MSSPSSPKSEPDRSGKRVARLSRFRFVAAAESFLPATRLLAIGTVGRVGDTPLYKGAGFVAAAAAAVTFFPATRLCRFVVSGVSVSAKICVSCVNEKFNVQSRTFKDIGNWHKRRHLAKKNSAEC
jgi:hypothetical protein